MNLSFYMPTKVLMGTECITKNSELFLELGKKALIVTGRNSARMNGSLDDVVKALEMQKIAYSIFDRVEPNPSSTTVLEGAEEARRFSADFIIGIGGGSPLDGAKAIALLSCNNLTGESMFSGTYPGKILPLAAVPTTAGTGSEVTPYSIITDVYTNRKRSLVSPRLFPVYAFLDARYTRSLTVSTTINTALDALSHAVEGYTANRCSELSDLIARESIYILGGVLVKISSDSTIDLEIREQLLYASMLAGQVIAQTGTTAPHSLGYSLTTHKNIDHGRANGLLMAAYLSFIRSAQERKVSSILELMRLESIDELKKLTDRLLGEKEMLSSEEIESFSSYALQTPHIKNTNPEPALDDLKKIYLDSFS